VDIVKVCINILYLLISNSQERIKQYFVYYFFYFLYLINKMSRNLKEHTRLPASTRLKHARYHTIYDDNSLIKTDTYDDLDYPINRTDRIDLGLMSFNTYYGSPIRTNIHRPVQPYFPQSLIHYSYMYEQKPPILPFPPRQYPPYSSYLTYPNDVILDPKWMNIGYVESKNGKVTLKLKARPDIIADQLDSSVSHFQYKIINPKGKVDISLHIDGILKDGNIIENINGFSDLGPWQVHLN
jgi:hypothetical protein